MAIVRYREGLREEALSLFEESTGIEAEIGELSGLAASLPWLAVLNAEEGEWDAAMEALREAVRLIPGLGRPDLVVRLAASPVRPSRHPTPYLPAPSASSASDCAKLSSSTARRSAADAAAW